MQLYLPGPSVDAHADALTELSIFIHMYGGTGRQSLRIATAADAAGLRSPRARVE